MTDDDRVLRLLGDVLDRQPTTAPDRLLTTVLDELQTAPQRGRWFLPNWRDLLTAPSVARLAVGGLVVAVIAVAMFQLTPRSALVSPGATSTSSPTIAPSTVASPSSTPALTAGSSPSTTPVPTDAASPVPTTTPSASEVAPIAIEGVGNPVTGTTYTSRLFEPRVTFKLATREWGSAGQDTTGEPTDWCSPQTSADQVTLSHPRMCVDTLSLFSPDAVDCGTPDAHPDAATLAAAVLAHPDQTGASDLGDLQTGGKVPSNLFRVPYRGRVIQVDPYPTAGPSVGDPYHCRLLPKPGTGTSPLEIRRGQAARLIFIDVDGGLVVVKVAAGLTNQAHLLTRIYDIEFGPATRPTP